MDVINTLSVPLLDGDTDGIADAPESVVVEKEELLEELAVLSDVTAAANPTPMILFVDKFESKDDGFPSAASSMANLLARERAACASNVDACNDANEK